MIIEGITGIDKFTGQYAFLSNFYPADIMVVTNGVTMVADSVEHVYQASKATNIKDFVYVISSETSGIAKRRGRQIQMRKDFDKYKLPVMLHLLMLKFCDPILRNNLINTSPKYLSEGNLWGDEFWGVNLLTGKGLNKLGLQLMSVRALIRRGAKIRGDPFIVNLGG